MKLFCWVGVLTAIIPHLDRKLIGVISSIERVRKMVKCNCDDPEQSMEFLESHILHTCQPWPSMGTLHIHFLDLRPSRIAGKATEPFAGKHATKGASISHLQSSYSAGTLSKVVRNGYSNTRIHVVGQKIILNKPAEYKGEASKRDIFVLTLMLGFTNASFPGFSGNLPLGFV